MAKTRKAIRRMNDKNVADLAWRKNQTEREMLLLQNKLESGIIPDSRVSMIELRLCKLMNETIPKFEKRIGDLLK